MEKNSRIGIRLSEEDKERWQAASSRQELTLSEWIELNMNRIANDILGPKRPRQLDGQMQFDFKRER